MADSSWFLLLSYSQEEMDSEIDLFHFVFLVIFYLLNIGNTVHAVTFIKDKGEKARQWFIHAEQILQEGFIYLLRKGVN